MSLTVDVGMRLVVETMVTTVENSFPEVKNKETSKEY